MQFLLRGQIVESYYILEVRVYLPSTEPKANMSQLVGIGECSVTFSSFIQETLRSVHIEVRVKLRIAIEKKRSA